MISLKNKFLFIHIPKTGGNSVQRILSNYSEDIITSYRTNQDGIERFGVENKEYNTKKHSTLSYYKSTLSKDVYNEMFKFSIIRNPWERMISLYFSPHSDVHNWDKDSFIRLIEQAKSASYYISEKQLDKHRTSFDVDYLIKYENLEKDFLQICKRIKIPYTVPERINRSVHKHYSYYYDNELIKLVNEKFKVEIDYGNYIFDNIAE